MSPQPELVGENGRRFPGFAAAVLVFIIDPSSRRLLLLSSPAKRGRPGWEIVNGGLEAGESLVEGVLREVGEEAGPSVRLRVLGCVHASTWRYDSAVTHMISTFFVASYLGGEVVPGDDMAGSAVRWVTQADVASMFVSGEALIPEDPWLFDRAFEGFDRWEPTGITLS